MTNRVIRTLISFAFTSGGIFLLAYASQFDVFQDPKRVELTGSVDNTGTSFTTVFFAALFVATGVTSGLAAVSDSSGRGRYSAEAAVFAGTFMAVLFHGQLFINSQTVSPEGGGATVSFTASYFFHWASGYKFPAVYSIFLVTTLVLALLVAGAAYLVAPERFGRAFGPRAQWAPMESLAVAASLFVVLTLVVYLVSLVEVALAADLTATAAESTLPGQPVDRPRGLLADNVVGMHYVTAILLGLLTLTIGFRVFMVNWGTQGVFRRASVLEALANLGRIERVLLGLVVAFDLVVLASPAVVGRSYLSGSPVFGLTSKMLPFFVLLTLAPYSLYAFAVRRMERLLDSDGGRVPTSTPFSNTSLRLVIVHLGGIVLLTATYAAMSAAGPVDTLGMMMAYTMFTAGVFLWAGVRFRAQAGVLRPRLRGAAGAAPMLGFVIFGLAAALMLWGTGNTFVATYHASTSTLTVENASVWGADILSRVAAAALAGFVLVLAVGVLTEEARLQRNLVAHNATIAVALGLSILVAFTAGVWSTRARGTAAATDAYVGMAFHQYGAIEGTLVGVVLMAALVALYVSFGRLFSGTVRRWAVIAQTRDVPR